MSNTGERLLEYIHNKHQEDLNSSTVRQRDGHSSRGISFANQLRNRFCSDSFLKFVYLSCATLISATFIIECILLHLIIVPYLAESAFESGECRYVSSHLDQTRNRCENKCSKERSNFPCLQIKVLFTPNSHVDVTDRYQSSGEVNKELVSKVHLQVGSITSANTSRTPTRYVYLYDYYSTFAAHKGSRCSTSPCHRREEDNTEAVEEFKHTLWQSQTFPCYARPYKPAEDYWEITVPNLNSELINQSDKQVTPMYQTPKDPKDASAILHRLYSRIMFLHSLCWPGGLFLGALLIIFFTYLIDGCQAWASDKTVIA